MKQLCMGRCSDTDEKAAFNNYDSLFIAEKAWISVFFCCRGIEQKGELKTQSDQSLFLSVFNMFFLKIAFVSIS